MKRLFLLSLVLLIPFAPARAGEIAALYRASWASLPAATIVYGFDNSADRYHDRIRIETSALPYLLTHFKAEAEAEGIFAKDMAVPSRYRALFDLRKRKNQLLDVNFIVRDGMLIAERAAGDMSRKPLLAEEFRRNVMDPISAFAAIRAHLRAKGAVTGDKFIIAVFDDTRRFDADIAVVAASPANAPIAVHFELKPIAGFKKNADEKSGGDDVEDAPRPVDLTFSNDGKFLPLSLSASIGYLPLNVAFEHLCTDFAACE